MTKTLADIIALHRPTEPASSIAAPDPTAPNGPETLNGAHISERMLACLVGLPLICAVRACRRHKRCYGPNAICLHHHSGLVDERLARDEQRERDAALNARR